MEKTIPDEIRSKLETTIQSAGKTFHPAELRKHNILWIENLTREGLAYGKKEKQLLMHTTKNGEKILMQYPGKETISSVPKPWDFRPELYLPEKGVLHENMTFGAMWATIFETAEKIATKNKEEILRVFATLLYRMAFMLDYIKVEPFVTKERDVIYSREDGDRFSEEREIKLPALYEFKPNEQVLKYIAKECPQWGKMSFEAFLFYNELLVWNEDCKYYYRNYHGTNSEKWIYTTGRVNTLLTHIRILGYMVEEIPLSDIFDGFARQQGISPASKEEVIRICGDFIKAG